MYPNSGEKYRNEERIGEGVILAMRKVWLQCVSSRVGEMITGTKKEYLSAASLEKADENQF